MKHNLKATVVGQVYIWTVEMGEASFMAIEAARKGLQEWLQDAASTAKPTDEEAKAEGMQYAGVKKETNKEQHTAYQEAMRPVRVRCMDERFAKIKNGTYKPGQGGGGAHQSPEDKAWITFFNATGHKEGGKAISGKTLKRAQEWHVRQILLNSADPGSDERRDIEANMGKHLAERFDEIIEKEQQENKPIAMGIEYQKMIASVPSA